MTRTAIIVDTHVVVAGLLTANDATRADLLLVTGDKRLLRDASMQGRVISAQTYPSGVASGA